MSIIEEALRRAQDPLTPKAQKPQAAVTEQKAPESQPAAHSWQAAPPSPTAPSTASQTAPLTAVAVLILILTVALVVGGAFWLGRTLAPQPHAQAASTPAAAAPSQPAAPVAGTAQPERPRTAETKKVQRTALVLSGLVEGEGESYAVINGLIVAPGERVGNATLEQIANGSVTLRDDDGRQIILRVPR